jgi:Putative metallopeptidase
MHTTSWFYAGVAVFCGILAGTPARAAAENPVHIEYGDASGDPTIDHARDVLMNAKALEELRSFMSPLRWPASIAIRADQCGGEHRAYDPAARTATICFEYVAHILDVVAAQSGASDSDKQQAAVGAIVESLLHETAYAIFDVYKVPIWGRADDAADRLAALVMTQFGSDSARTTIYGTVRFFAWSARTWSGTDFADAQSPEAQRYFNFLCVAIGADPVEFAHVIDDGLMPPHRAARCLQLRQTEYEQIRKAFNLRIMPYVDPDGLIKSRAQEW